MKILQNIIGILIGFATIILLFITSFEIATYGDYSWYEKEYEKYDVLTDLEMEMPEVRKVTEEMMAYLRGNRKDLVVETVVDGQEREFFNDREKAHMVDVKNLFVGGLWVRRGLFVLVLAAFVFLVKSQSDWLRILPRSFLIAMGSFVGITIGAGALFMTDFTKYFTIFHEIFFDNDLWLLDPATDLLIRMLPEGFFLDMMIRIGWTFVIMMGIVILISVALLITQKIRKTNDNI